ncbi:MAG: hypothetical protein EBQ92_10030 [Proteobacteria bacterium]|nr:hypothetical protein [Pseudomonadota bacterium]
MPKKRESDSMLHKSANKVFGFLAMSFLFLSVACSHNKTAVSKLEGLSEEVAASQVESQPTEESAPAGVVSEAEAVVEAPVEVVAEAKVEAPAEVVPTTEVVATASPSPSENDFAVPASAPSVEVAKAENDFSVPVAESNILGEPGVDPKSSVATQNQNDLSNQAQSDLDSVARKKKKRGKKGWGNSLSKLDEAVLAEKMAAENAEASAEVSDSQKELASPNMSTFIERNLLWFALAIVGGLISVFFTVRRNRKSTDTNV